ncbi:MAG: TlpA family protein disulfide reductase [Oligoflexia bacterium]|nr:TlpA family protein disulfide reductase [Oligoflexia bacterium]
MLYPILILGAALATPAAAAVPVGAAARAFALPAINSSVAMSVAGDTDVALFDFTGLGAPHPQSAVVVHFFERGAGDDVLKQLSRLDQKHDDLVVIGVMADSHGVASVSAWMAQQDLAFPVLFDEFRVVFSRYGIHDAPVTLVVDGDGYVFAVGRPMGDDFEAQLESVLAPLLGS